MLESIFKQWILRFLFIPHLMFYPLRKQYSGPLQRSLKCYKQSKLSHNPFHYIPLNKASQYLVFIFETQYKHPWGQQFVDELLTFNSLTLICICHMIRKIPIKICHNLQVLSGTQIPLKFEEFH
jgi:hypothetical protein